MPEQLSLPGFEAAPQPTDRLFFAIFPDVDAAARIAQLARRLRSEHGLKGKPLATKRLHVTLHYLGDYVGLPQAIVAAASAAAATVALPSFEVALDRVASFSGRPRNRPFVLLGGDGVAALTAFQQALGTALEKAGLGSRAKSPYTPHVTLLYGNHSVAGQAVETVGWTVHEFVLVHSLLGRTRHVPLARWPLLP
jgi:RNA 2',3'-cyclic 3'-phosphodiesterase